MIKISGTNSSRYTRRSYSKKGRPIPVIITLAIIMVLTSSCGRIVSGYVVTQIIRSFVNKNNTSEDFSNVATVYENNANFRQAVDLYDKGEYYEAEKFLLEAYSELQVKYSQDTLEMAAVNCFFAKTYCSLEQYNKCGEYAMNAYTTFDKYLGITNTQTRSAKYYVCISNIYNGNTSQGYADFSELIKYTKGDHEVVVTYVNFAAFCFQVDDYTMAQKCYDFLFDYFDSHPYLYESCQCDDVHTIRLYADLSTFERIKGNLPASLEYILKAISEHEKHYDGITAGMADAYQRASQIYLDLFQCDEALRYADLALEATKKLFGEINKDAARIYQMYGDIYSELKSLDEAIQNYQRAADIAMEATGNHSILLADIYTSMSIYYQSRCYDTEKAIEYCLKGIDIYKDNLSSYSVNCSVSYQNLAEFYANLGREQDTYDASLKSLQILIIYLGEDNVRTSTAYSQLALICYEIGDTEDALLLANRSNAFYEKFPDNFSWRKGYTEYVLGHILVGIEQYNEGYKHLIQAYSIFSETQGETHNNTKMAYNKLVKLYQTLAPDMPFDEWLKTEHLAFETSQPEITMSP